MNMQAYQQENKSRSSSWNFIVAAHNNQKKLLSDKRWFLCDLKIEIFENLKDGERETANI